jgi:hypothetical protein
MWEYKRIDLSFVPTRNTDVDALDQVGKDGWELVAITRNNQAYLKRRVVPAKPSPGK